MESSQGTETTSNDNKALSLENGSVQSTTGNKV